MGAHARASPTYSLDAVESCFLPHDAMHSADYAVTRCLSVRPSVAARYFIETARYVIILFSLSASHTILVFPYQTIAIHRRLHPPPPNGMSNAVDMKNRDSANISLYRGNYTKYCLFPIRIPHILCGMRIGNTIFSDLERPETQISRSRHYLTLKILVWPKI